MENINNLKSIVQNRFRLLAKYFLNRKDRFGVQVKGSALSAECESAEDLLNGHLSSSFPPVKIKVKSKQGDYEVEGNFRASSYAQDENGKTKWMCMDLDGGKEHKSPLADAEKTAVGILKKLKEAGVTAYLEKSRSGFGYHIWVFFRSPVPISKARALGLTYAPTDAPLMEVGKVANPVTNIGIEIFPKSFESKSDGYGNFVYFPWHYGAPKGANQFLELDGENLSQYEPDDFTTVDENIVDEKIKDFKFSSKSTRDKHYDRTVGNREFLKPDTKAVQEGCGFIKHCDKNRKTLSELEWFHLAGVFAALPNGRDLFHKFSKDYPGYSREETDSKFDRFSNATGPITCAAIEKIHESCASCPYFKKITTPIQIGEISSARELGKKMLEESKTDPGAPFLPLSIQAMHIQRFRHPVR